MKRRKSKSETGMALVIVLFVGSIFAMLGFTLLKLAEYEMSLTQKAIRKSKAFCFAEAGVARFVTNAYNGEFRDIEDTFLEEGSYRVDSHSDEYPPYAIATGNAGGEQKRIRVELSFLSLPYEHAMFSGNLFGQDWTLDLRGTGVPQSPGGRWGWGSNREVGGRDSIHGDVYVDGNVTLYEESRVNPAILPNTYGLNGDVDATGTIDTSGNIYGDESISGTTQENAEIRALPDLLAMNYSVNNSHDVSKAFEGISSGRLPRDNELYDVVVKNPRGMSDECASTPGVDDYFFEPATIRGSGSYDTATTPLHMSDGAIYYVDGNVWIHNPTTYGFLVDGKVTIVATGDIRICDNIEYADDQSVLGLVALGKYNSANELVSGGNIYFGDPRFGTTYTVSALMFAANDFLYNTDSVTRSVAEPETGFTVYGNFAAANHVSIQRDWYDPDGTWLEARPTHFDPSSDQWIDTGDGTVLTPTEIDSLRHYRMRVIYDERVRNVDTQPPGLPRGPGAIFNGITYWEELTPSQ